MAGPVLKIVDIKGRTIAGLRARKADKRASDEFQERLANLATALQPAAAAAGLLDVIATPEQFKEMMTEALRLAFRDHFIGPQAR